MSAILQNFPCFLINTTFPVGESEELVCLFWVGSKLSVCRLLLPGVLVSSRPASLGDAVVLAAGSESLSTSPDAQITPKVSRRDYCALLSSAEHTRNYFSWFLFSLRGFSESLLLWLPLQPLLMRENRRRMPESLTSPGRAGERNEEKTSSFQKAPHDAGEACPCSPQGKERDCNNRIQTCVLFAIKSIDQTRSAWEKG